jgi:hypothetical protein
MLHVETSHRAYQQHGSHTAHDPNSPHINPGEKIWTVTHEGVIDEKSASTDRLTNGCHRGSDLRCQRWWGDAPKTITDTERRDLPQTGSYWLHNGARIGRGTVAAVTV